MQFTDIRPPLVGSLDGISDAPVFCPGTSPFTVDLSFCDAALGAVSLTRSTDGGVTFSLLQNGEGLGASRSAAGRFTVVDFRPDALYRLERSHVGGKVSFVVSRSAPGDHIPLEDNLCFGAGDPTQGFVSISDAQLQRLYRTLFTPLSDAALAGDMTLYKTWFDAGNIYVRLSVPADAQRVIGFPGPMLGAHRIVRAEYADVVSVVDCSGNPLPSVPSGFDPQMIYKPGARVTAVHRENGDPGSSGHPFADPRSRYGIYGFPTLLEAATSMHSRTHEPPNLTALGL